MSAAGTLARIARDNPALKALTLVDAAAMAPLDAPARGPLAGFSIAVKANIDVQGWPTTAGVRGRGAPARADAPVVARLRAAGAAIVAQANMHEAALGTTSDNPHFGRTANPHRAGRTPGGSSGGSAAAVAAGMVRAALGTDTMGSVRIPAACCGIYGLKPSHGAVPAAGLVPLAASLDVIGPLARSVEDLAALSGVMMALAAPRPVQRVAVLADLEAAELQPAVRHGHGAARTALQGLGITVETLPLAGLDLKAARLGGFFEAAEEARLTFAAELAAGTMSPAFVHMMDHAAAAAPERIAKARAARETVRAAVLAALDAADLLLMPVMPMVAPAHGARADEMASFTALANYAGVPALAMPVGFDGDGLPVAVQLLGRAGDEATLLAVAARLDAVLQGWRPPPGYF
ncbi:MAG: amidase [Polymorphobacter sp.]|uniref:amidase n=1 Tax=Polymorphobacter sp. TaxID=1909290 RepID=UPI003A88C23D